MVRQNMKVPDTPLDKIGFTAKVSSPRTSLNYHRRCCREAHCRLVVDEVGVVDPRNPTVDATARQRWIRVRIFRFIPLLNARHQGPANRQFCRWNGEYCRTAAELTSSQRVLQAASCAKMDQRAASALQNPVNIKSKESGVKKKSANFCHV